MSSDLCARRQRGGFGNPANMLIVMGVGIAGIGLYALQQQTWSRAGSVAAVGILVAGAAALFGVLLGFLFGIPRTLRSEHPPDQEAGARESEANRQNAKSVHRTSFIPNTNLDQISDWLTKILVGVGLTQSSPILNKARELSAFVAKGMGAPEDGQVISAAILAFFCVSGFLLGYLWTRLYLAPALHESDLAAAALDEAQLAMVEAKKASERANEVMIRQHLADATALQLANRQLRPDTSEPPIDLRELRSAIMQASADIRENILADATRLRRDSWETDKPAMERTIPIFQALVDTDTEGRCHRCRAQLAYTYKDKHGPTQEDYKRAEELLTDAIRIRGPSEQEGYLFYECIRAMCGILVDEDFRQRKRSGPEARERIRDDIVAAAHDPYASDVLERERVFRLWLEKNRIPPPWEETSKEENVSKAK